MITQKHIFVASRVTSHESGLRKHYQSQTEQVRHQIYEWKAKVKKVHQAPARRDEQPLRWSVCQAYSTPRSTC